MEKSTPKNETEITQIALFLLEHKTWIIRCTATITLIGIVYALLVSPRYYSQATIALKDSGKNNSASSIFSQLGSVGGAVASQLGAGNTNITKAEIILKSRDLAESVIENNDLMPILFHNLWDSTKHAWKSNNPKKAPPLWKGVALLSKGLLQVSTDEKKGIIRVGVTFYDPSLAKKIVEDYLKELNDKIRLNVMSDADSNRGYLERELNNTSDPVLVGKIQNLIAGEIEKSMLMASSSFETLEKPFLPMEKAYPKKRGLVIMSFLIGIISSVASLFVWRSLVSFKKTIRDTSSLENHLGV